jgi:hypothetical protein
MTVVLVETTQPPTVAQISVTPLLLGKFIVPFHVYDPDAKVMVAPSEAEAIALLTSETALPAAQLHDLPEPVQAAAALDGKMKNKPTRVSNRAQDLYAITQPILSVRNVVKNLL